MSPGVAFEQTLDVIDLRSRGLPAFLHVTVDEILLAHKESLGAIKLLRGFLFPTSTRRVEGYFVKVPNALCFVSTCFRSLIRSRSWGRDTSEVLSLSSRARSAL